MAQNWPIKWFLETPIDALLYSKVFTNAVLAEYLECLISKLTLYSQLDWLLRVSAVIMGLVLISTLILILFSAPNSAIVIKIIPEILNGFNHSFNGRCEMPCQFSANPNSPDAEFFIAMADQFVRDAITTPPSAPFRLIGGQEPPHYYPLMKPEFLKHHFHGTSFLYRHSDIPWLIIPNGNLESLRLSEVSPHAQPKATFVAINCNPMNNRNEYVRAIAEVVGVVAPSSCLNNAIWPQCGTRPCTKTEMIHDYKFHLAFENGDSPGFITDRIYHSFEAGVLPVWMGTREVAEVVPPGSYIDVAEFDGPYAVANYLKSLLDNETLYASYFEWKKKPLNPNFVEENRVLWTESHQCRSCYFVDALKRGLEWDHLRQRAKSDTEITHEDRSRTETQNTRKEGAKLDLETTHREPPKQANPINQIYFCPKAVVNYAYRSNWYSMSVLLNIVLLALLIWKKCFKNLGRNI